MKPCSEDHLNPRPNPNPCRWTKLLYETPPLRPPCRPQPSRPGAATQAGVCPGPPGEHPPTSAQTTAGIWGPAPQSTGHWKQGITWKSHRVISLPLQALSQRVGHGAGGEGQRRRRRSRRGNGGRAGLSGADTTSGLRGEEARAAADYASCNSRNKGVRIMGGNCLVSGSL